MSIYKYLDYRKAIDDTLRSVKNVHGLTYQTIAEQAQIQPTTLTNTIKKRVHLSADQIYSLGAPLRLGADELEFLVLLMEKERASNSLRKKQIASKIDHFRNRAMETVVDEKTEVINSQQLDHYYLNPDLLLTHLMMGIVRFQKTPARISSALRISHERVHSALKELEKMRLLERKKGHFHRTKASMHMPKKYPLRKAHQQLMRLRGEQQLSATPDTSQYNFMVTFSANEETRHELQRKFLEFIEQAQSAVRTSEVTDVYQLNFDLFKWTE